MLARTLLLCFALGLAEAALRPKLLCSDLKPIADLSIEQIRGDWITLSLLSTPEGDVPQQLVGQAPYSPHCIFAHVHENSTQGELALGLYWHMDCNETHVYEDSYKVSAEGRWIEVPSDLDQTKREEYSVLFADPARYLVLASCKPVGPEERHSNSHVVNFVYVLSRYSPLIGQTVVTDEEYDELRAQTARSLGLKLFNPPIFENSCFSDHK